MVPLDEDARKLIYKEYKIRMMKQRLAAGAVGLAAGIATFWIIQLFWEVI